MEYFAFTLTLVLNFCKIVNVLPTNQVSTVKDRENLSGGKQRSNRNQRFCQQLTKIPSFIEVSLYIKLFSIIYVALLILSYDSLNSVQTL